MGSGRCCFLKKRCVINIFQVFKASWALSSEGIFKKDPWFIITGSKIIDRGFGKPPKEFFCKSLPDGVVVPGFVNAHSHLELSAMKGKTTRNQKITGFAKEIMKLRSELEWKDVTRASANELEYAYSRGTFYYNDICNNIRFLEYLRSAKYFNGNRFFEMLGFSEPRDDETIQDAQKILDSDRNVFISPHSCYGSSPKILSFVREYARLTTLTIHLLESAEESGLPFQKGGIYHFLKEIGSYKLYPEMFHKNILNYLYEMGMLSFKKLFLIHLVHAQKTEMEYLNNLIPHAAWVLCMRSNEFIGEIRQNWNLMEKTPLRLLIGTDSTASSPDVSILDEMLAIYKAGYFSEKQLLRAATFSAYEYMEIPLSRVPFFFFPGASASLESLASIKKAFVLRG